MVVVGDKLGKVMMFLVFFEVRVSFYVVFGNCLVSIGGGREFYMREEEEVV